MGFLSLVVYRGSLPSRSSQQSEGQNLVVPRGNAPRSLAYQASALLLSYRTESGGRRR
jgi:hypothetical protein